jgi:NAD-dependent deacetylase
MFIWNSVVSTTTATTMLNGRVLVITGAGVSAESGIPTFRDKDGYWRNLDPSKLATPEAFARDPRLVWEWYRERRQRIRNAKPNAGHEAVAKLAQESNEFLLVTQNVDDLHARAEWNGKRLRKDQMVQIHGNIFVTRCSRCEFSRAEREGETEQEQDRVPACLQCGAFMRPGVVWFDEQLDASEIEGVEDYLDQGPCDAVIVVGTTAVFGYIINWALRAAGENGWLIEINPEETPLSQFARQRIREPAGVALPRLVASIVNNSSP